MSQIVVGDARSGLGVGGLASDDDLAHDRIDRYAPCLCGSNVGLFNLRRKIKRDCHFKILVLFKFMP
jgi:hypothetical protein